MNLKLNKKGKVKESRIGIVSESDRKIYISNYGVTYCLES